MTLEHEQVVVRRGSHSGLPVIVAVHSTVLGQAVGGCRVWPYPDWTDGLADAMRLSQAMTYKNAVAGLPNGGGKVVVALPPGVRLSADRQRAAMLDVGEAVESLGGRYGTGPDAGTGPADMAVVAERTGHVFCLPVEDGGSGDPSPYTALGVVAALEAVCRVLPGPAADLAGRRITLVGAGHVGGHLARLLAEAGADLLISDIDPGRRALADRLGAEFAEPEEALTAPADILVPAALGGVLTADLVPRLRCAAVVGPANNQLATPEVADLLHERGILWAPDYVVSAGGVVYAASRELHRDDHDRAVARVTAIGDTVLGLLTADGSTPAGAAAALVGARLGREG